MTEEVQILDRLIEQHFDDPEAVPVTVEVEAQRIREWLARYDFAETKSLAEVVEDVAWKLREWTEHAAHPMHFGLFRPPIDRASVIADTLAALYDPNLATWEFAPAANEIERHILAVIGKAFGFRAPNVAAHFTSGGQEANHTAVVVALARAFPSAIRNGLRSLPGTPRFYVSEEAHHSLEKVAHLTGLGDHGMRVIPVGDDLAIDLEALRAAIADDRVQGFLPFLVVGTAGTTNAGIIDPLEELAELAREENVWFHVDAAWGGGAALSKRLRPSLRGIERADSVTCDAHKLLSVPVGAGMFFCGHPDAVAAAFQVHAPYAPETRGEAYPFATSMQWSRRFIGLKVFLMFAARGLPEIARRVEHQAEMGRLLRSLLQARGWRLLNATPLPVVCFSHEALDVHDDAASAIVRALRQEGSAWISKTDLPNHHGALRACVTNYNSEERHIRALVDLIEDALHRLNIKSFKSRSRSAATSADSA